MNWQAVSFDWNQIRAFLATAEEGSLSAAARALGTTQPTVGRQVAALETALGVTLFERLGKTLRITDAGQELLAHVQDMAEAASRVSMVAAGQSQAVSGRVSITAADIFAAAYLPPILRDLRRIAPQIDITVIASSQVENLARRDADIAIRHVRPEQPDLVARLIGTFEAGFFAATSYLDLMGRPQSVHDLGAHRFIGATDLDDMRGFYERYGVRVRDEQFSYQTENGVVMWEMMRVGLGICTMPTGIWQNTAGVERVLPALEPFTFPIWLVAHRELHTSRKIRVVYDALAEALTRLRFG
ncbi:LysR family transcriptional regulator [Loktanella sp. S4079]|uniref:LysR family transcriptional regulator n=1 Tax=Loktanella sp. S4079 TaxID=579483 RepID=UPI0005FA5750|nr:LysR family transcriptional regulator [Loktanella sp. S4079]KJZ20725.1 LysR family transcriptional regulator [Loktanella sp. S4079]